MCSFHLCMLQPCFPGLISSEDRVDCKLCPAGFSCDLGNGTLSLCPTGQHSPEGVLQCLSCPVDSVCTSGFPQRVSLASRLSQFEMRLLCPVLYVLRIRKKTFDKAKLAEMSVNQRYSSFIDLLYAPYSVGLARSPA